MTEGKKSPAPDADDGAYKTAPRPNRLPPSTRSTPSDISPSPFRLVWDAIDATCHKILLSMGMESGSIAPFASYAPLLECLDWYMETLGDPNDDGGPWAVKRGGPYGLRLFMANLAVRVCSRLAYPEQHADTSVAAQRPKSNLESLIETPSSEWEELSDDMGRLHENLRRGDGKLSLTFESLKCQMEAMKALAGLRRKLLEVLSEINGKDNDQCSVLQFLHISSDIEEYETSSGIIDGKLRDIHQTDLHDDLFVPHEVLALKNHSFDTIEKMQNSLALIIDDIDDMINKNAFPLHNFQVQFLKLLKDWERSYLPTPILFRAEQYFKTGESPSSLPSAAADASTPVSSPTPTSLSHQRKGAAKNESEFGSDDDRHSVVSIVADIQNAKRTRRRRSERNLDDGSGSNGIKPMSMLTESPGKALSSPDSGGRTRSISTKTPSPCRQREKARKQTKRQDDNSVAEPSQERSAKKRKNRTPFSEINAIRSDVKPLPDTDDESKDEFEFGSDDDRYSVADGNEPLSGLAKSPAKTLSLPDNGGRTRSISVYGSLTQTPSPPPKKKKKRIPFSEEEMHAIRKGVKLFPVKDGQMRWKEILDHYSDVFEANNRTNVSLKDKYRSMLKRGDI